MAIILYIKTVFPKLKTANCCELVVKLNTYIVDCIEIRYTYLPHAKLSFVYSNHYFQFGKPFSSFANAHANT